MVATATGQGLVAEWRELAARHAAVFCALERELHAHALGVSDFEVLDRLAGAKDDSHRVQELADSVHLSQSALSLVIGRLERDGLVSRSLCAEDRRGIYVCLTDAGRAKHAQAKRTHRAVLAEHLTS
jgi:DNA-binding MarR family transcriptional regulator